jgi:hypothetical protein
MQKDGVNSECEIGEGAARAIDATTLLISREMSPGDLTSFIRIG